jgi:hypothetical protein
MSFNGPKATPRGLGEVHGHPRPQGQGRSQLLGFGGVKLKKNNLGGQNYKFFNE